MVELDDIQTEFADLDLEITDDVVLEQLSNLCNKYKIDATKISCEYFSFNTKNKQLLGQPPTMESLVTFETEKLKVLKTGPRKPLDPIEGAENLPDTPDLCPGTPTRLVNKRQVTPDIHLAKRLVTAAGTPALCSSVPSSPAVVSKKFTERTNRGEVVTKHNTDLTGDWKPSLTQSLDLTIDQSSVSKPYKYMFERLRDRAAVIDETICSVGERLVPGMEEMDMSLTNTDGGLVVGRVQCDGEGRLNSNSVLLQGSLDTCGGVILPLDLSQVDKYSLFPGQVIAADCTNPNGTRLVASKMHAGVTRNTPTTTSLADGEVMSILTACGPFSTSDSDSLEPLVDLLTKIKTDKPSLVILMGPFLDMKNQMIETSVDSYDKQWQTVLAMISSETSNLDIEIVLVPSYRDVHCHPVYPQPPVPVTPETSQLYRDNLRCVSDPCILTVRGVKIALSSTDILFHLGKEEISYPPRSGDRMSRLAGHLLQQSSFYPLYPPSEEVNIDYERLEQHSKITTTPHLLLLPSDLNNFVREVDSCTVVNPGRLTKGPGPGTYSNISLRGGEGGVKTRVEIVRI